MAGAQIVKWGNSLAIRIPKPLAEEAGLSEGDRVLMEAADGQIKLRRADIHCGAAGDSLNLFLMAGENV